MKNTGSASEQEFERRLKAKCGKRVFIYRVTDSKEVRGRTGLKTAFTKAQPSDYIVTQDGKMFYAEVKSSNSKTSFPFSQISTVQWASAKLQLMAMGHYYFFLHNVPADLWFKVPAHVLLTHDKKSLKWSELTTYLWRI